MDATVFPSSQDDNQVFKNMVTVSMVYSLTAQLCLRSQLLWHPSTLFFQLTQTSSSDDSSSHFDPSLVTLPKLLDGYCGPKNLAPIVVKIWAGLNAIFGSGRTPPVAAVA